MGLTCLKSSVSLMWQRWDVDTLEEQPMRFSTFLEDVDKFDMAAFGIFASEAVQMDPQQRLLLECVGEAIATQRCMESAPSLGQPSACPLPGEPGCNCGIYVGIASTEYRQLASSIQSKPTTYSASGHLTTSVAAGRISYTFGLKGPSVPGR